jgi:hypothetical protein
MTFEDLLKLKERLGTKVYDEAMFGTSSKKSNKPENFKRVNKNRYAKSNNLLTSSNESEELFLT